MFNEKQQEGIGEIDKQPGVITIEMDTKFFAILPALNVNFHSRTFEFEWLCFGIYIRSGKK